MAVITQTSKGNRTVGIDANNIEPCYEKAIVCFEGMHQSVMNRSSYYTTSLQTYEHPCIDWFGGL